jgi:hypothetical protein
MEQKVIVSPDVDQVTINIEKQAPQKERLTLRKAIMMLPTDVPLDLIVHDILNDGSKMLMAWKITLGVEPSVNHYTHTDISREHRIKWLSACTLCDMQVLLDERDAVINVCTDHNGKIHITVTIEANPDK